MLRMWEKAFIGDDGSQFSRKRSVRPCGLNSKGLSLCLFELNYRMWGRKTEAKNEFTVRSHSAFVEFQIIHTVNDFSQSLLDFLESRVMKRKSINHCEERSEMERLRKRTPFLRWRAQLQTGCETSRLVSQVFWQATQNKLSKSTILWYFMLITFIILKENNYDRNA